MCAKDFLEIFPMTLQVPVQISRWEVEELSLDQYRLKVHYTFVHDGMAYSGTSPFVKQLYLNSFSAIDALKQKAKISDWSVWVDPSLPEHSAIEKEFSFNLLFRALLSTGLLVYFYLQQRLNRCSKAV